MGTANTQEAKFFSGTYLGLRMGTNDMYIGTMTAVVKVAATKRRTEQERCAWSELKTVVGTLFANRKVLYRRFITTPHFLHCSPVLSLLFPEPIALVDQLADPELTAV